MRTVMLSVSYMMMGMITTTTWSTTSAAQSRPVAAFAMQQERSGAHPDMRHESRGTGMADAERQLARKISLVVRDTLVADALREVTRLTGVKFGYAHDVLDLRKRVSVDAHDTPARDVVTSILRGMGVTFGASDGEHIALVRTTTTSASPSLSGGVTGTVVDATTRRPLVGATVSLDNVPKGTLTNAQGTYRLVQIPAGAYVLRVRMLGYVRQTQRITVTDDQTTTMTIAMEPSVSALDQVVVTGTIVATAQRAIPTTMTVITAKEIEQRGISKIDDLFHGDVPGLFALNQGSYSGDGTGIDQVMMFSRGSTSLTFPNTNPIKTYVDGIEMADPTFLNTIDPQSIERIEILTGPQASTIYGSNAINGVMQVFTKRGSTSARPQFVASLQSGWVQNNFRSTFSPQHDYSAQVNGTEQRWSYNIGGSWNYIAPWTPVKQTTQLGGFGGTRMQWPTSVGGVSADASLRLRTTKNNANGDPQQSGTARSETGWWSPSYTLGRVAPRTSTVNSQTLGLTMGYTPTAWWSHELVLGSDLTARESYTHTPNYIPQPSNVICIGGCPKGTDTVLSFSQSRSARTSFRYSTTARVALTSLTQAVITLGADQWQNLTTSLEATPTVLTGTINGPTPTVTRRTGHNAGGFVQGQLSVRDALFFTYGLRAEWNPNYGDDAQPNLAPKYGVAYTREIGPVTTKARFSYGRSTRPPTENQKSETWNENATYGRYQNRLANPELGPEYQQGAEGGLEFYVGNRGSLIITRYNQTVDDLIASPQVDSVQSLAPNVSTGLYTYTFQLQNLNIGSIRNQGWELQGTVNTGPLTTKGTYSWTKSRVIGITPRYRPFLTGAGFQVGRTYSWLPEHTWAVAVTYAHRASSLSLNLTGSGLLYRSTDDITAITYGSVRLNANRPRISLPTDYRARGPAYAMADMNGSHRFSPRLEGVLQVHNVTDYYRNDQNGDYASMGRQTKMGFRVRW